MNGWTAERRASHSEKMRGRQRAKENPLSDDDRRLVRRLWAERKRLLVEMQRIRDDADDRIDAVRAEAKQLTLESVARKFECSITQIHHIIGES